VVVKFSFALRTVGDFSLSAATVRANGSTVGSVVVGNDPPLTWEMTTPQAPSEAAFAQTFSIPNWTANGKPGTAQAGNTLQGSASVSVSYPQNADTHRSAFP